MLNFFEFLHKATTKHIVSHIYLLSITYCCFFLFISSTSWAQTLADGKRDPQENVNLLQFATDLTSFVYDYPLAFHGIGENRLNQPEDYKAQYYTLELRQRLKLLENFYLKFQYEQRFYNIIEAQPGGVLESGQILGSESKDLVSRVGASIDFDSRDNRMSPLTGGFYNVSLLIANNLWGRYKMIDLRMDLRQYFALSYRSVLGVQAIVQSITGEAPFHMLAEIGNSRSMRGFNTGQYRDKKLLLVQTEYRFPIAGRIGGVVFSSVGDVESDFRNFDWREFKSSLGVGLRYNLFKGYRAKLRLDYGISNEGDRRFYIHLAEAF